MMRAIARPLFYAALVLAAAGSVRSATPGECQNLRLHGQSAQSQSCFQALARGSSPYLRAEGDWGLRLYDQANNEFRQAVAQDDRSALYRVRWGMLLHERFNNTDAEQLFKEALQRDPKDAQACLGLALVSADGFDSKALEWTSKALELDPRLVSAHELAANLALEDSDGADAIQQADRAIQLAPNDALDALAIRAAIEILADRSPGAWFAKITAINPHYGEADAIVAHHLELNYRYEDAIAYYREAIEADPQLWSARSQHGVNLMRLGEDDEARRQLVMCYDNDFRDAATVNSLRLLDSEKNYETFHDGNAILKLNQNEAGLLRPYFDEIVQRAMAAYDKKYQMTLPGPVQVEAYPDHEDFAVRTLGMPGLGALGVTFGLVVVMDSPSARKPGDFNWASTLWHEMSHVYILTATNHRVPRWFTEGLAVHEETQANPEWGDPITPDIVVALRDKKLLPVTGLDRGFVRPEYDAQVIVSYYQAGRICDYIQSRWGNQKLLDLVHSFAARKTTAEAIQADLGMSPAEFDKEFQAWVYQGVGQVPQNFDTWHNDLKQLAADSQSHNYDAVLKEGPEVVQLYPQYIYDANAYQFIAEADVAKGNKSAAAAELTDYQRHGGRDPDTLKELAGLQQDLGRPNEAAATLDRINYIYPMDADVHRRLGALWLAQHNYAGAIREFNAVVDLHPLDKASAEYDLAQAYFDSGQRDKAENCVLASLEAAPDYRPAQKLLLQLHGSQ
ncbi:MAG: tetratricopeptide repeat protein [Acidobacteriota bacterium]|nr:tetratricopeptide repeat protein [Acidobacteriota bacterium]